MAMEDLISTRLFDLSKTAAAPIFESVTYPWEVLPLLSDFIIRFGRMLPEKEYRCIGEDIWVSLEAKVAPTAYLGGPLIVCPGAELRHCAFVRGSAIIGSGAVVGNSTELKNSILFDGAQAPHYNYVGDSVLGYKAHMGAGSITSNLKSDKSPVQIATISGRIQTGLKKMGAIVGDCVEVGCNSVLNPGTIIGVNTTVYPLSMVRGYIPPNAIYKHQGEVVGKLDEKPEPAAFCE